MTDRLANQDVIDLTDVFDALHTGLMVSLISTQREDFMTCTPNEDISNLRERNAR